MSKPICCNMLHFLVPVRFAAATIGYFDGLLKEMFYMRWIRIITCFVTVFKHLSENIQR